MKLPDCSPFILYKIGLAIDGGCSEEQQRETWGDSTIDWYEKAIQDPAFIDEYPPAGHEFGFRKEMHTYKVIDPQGVYHDQTIVVPFEINPATQSQTQVLAGRSAILAIAMERMWDTRIVSVDEQQVAEMFRDLRIEDVDEPSPVQYRAASGNNADLGKACQVRIPGKEGWFEAIIVGSDPQEDFDNVVVKCFRTQPADPSRWYYRQLGVDDVWLRSD